MGRSIDTKSSHKGNSGPSPRRSAPPVAQARSKSQVPPSLRLLSRNGGNFPPTIPAFSTAFPSTMRLAIDPVTPPVLSSVVLVSPQPRRCSIPISSLARCGRACPAPRGARPHPFAARPSLLPNFQPTTSNLFLFTFLRTLLHRAKSHLLSFHAIPDSFAKTPGVGGPRRALRASRSAPRAAPGTK